MSLQVHSPLAGSTLALEAVPDPVFSGKIVGPGIALDPLADDAAPGPVTALAPVAGTVVKVHPHAFVIVSEQGQGVLVHLGLDTVGLNGKGFEVHASEGSQVAVGEPMVTWDPAAVKAGGLSPVVPVVLLEADESALELAAPGAKVSAGDVVVTM